MESPARLDIVQALGSGRCRAEMLLLLNMTDAAISVATEASVVDRKSRPV